MRCRCGRCTNGIPGLIRFAEVADLEAGRGNRILMTSLEHWWWRNDARAGFSGRLLPGWRSGRGRMLVGETEEVLVLARCGPLLRWLRAGSG